MTKTAGETAFGLFASDAPAIHPRLLDPSAVAELAAQWSSPGALRIEDALAPGIAAELAPYVRRLPHVVTTHPDPASILWGHEVGVPTEPDPQYRACLFQLGRFLDRDLPALVAGITGRDYAFAAPGRVRALVFRRGCYADAPSAPPPVEHVVVAIHLTGEQWPAAWGGHIEILDDDGAVIARRPPSFAAIDLIAGRRFRIPMLTHHVESVLVTGHLEPA